MNNPRLISIVTPFFNSKKYFEKTFKSVLSQTYTNWEWIIVDDCSEKSEADFLDDIAKQDTRIQIIHNKTRNGPAFSRNIAIRKSQGDYVAFLDSDDYWASTKLEKQLNFMVENNYDFSATYFDVYDERDERITKLMKAPVKCTHKKLLRLNYIGCLTAMYKRSIFPDLQIPQTIKKRNDYAIWLKLSEKATCYVLKENLATYVRHFDNSVSSVNKTKMIKYHRDMFEILYGYSKFKATFYAYRNVFFYALKEVFYVSKPKNETNQFIEEENELININEIDVFENCIKCNFIDNVYKARFDAPVFKAIFNELNLTGFSIYDGNEKKDLSTYLRIYVDVYDIGVFTFFFQNINIDQSLISQRLRALKEKRVKYKIDAVSKIKEMFNLLEDFDYSFSVYKAGGEHYLKPTDFYKAQVKALIVVEY